MSQEATPENIAVTSDIVGELTVSEMRSIEASRQSADAIVREIGNLEVRKAQLLGRLNQIEAQAQATLNEAARRFGIPAGQSWQLLPDGKVRRTSPTPPPTA